MFKSSSDANVKFFDDEVDLSIVEMPFRANQWVPDQEISQ